ncbi:hypothetical protein [Flavobacterium johnsoniae]|uniref:Uncharacterized protein n=1 Tax=Flavobacterium johnsoniae TaxID=986 RepID=A0A1M5NNN6_FLAJO|nr:hypothetical protein [Flavobacterium johnsoniae]SHG91108.1 hypothetical protein SAMN05444388_10574 [Flavobacterium johnsoniae]
MNTIQQRNIKFINKIIDGKIYKMATGGIGHIQSITDIEVLNKFIDMVTTTINGDFTSIEEDPDVSSNYEVAFITPNGIEIMDENVENVIDLIPLQEFKEILIGWRDFLLTPPLNGSKVYISGEINDDNEIEKFLEGQPKEAKNEIFEDKLKAYPKQNKLVFIVSLSLFILFLLFFLIIIPLLNMTNEIIPFSILGAFAISLSGFYSLLYYKSWKKDFIKKVGKPKLSLQTYFLVCSLPTVLFYFLIYWNSLEGPGHNLYKSSIMSKLLKLFFP